MPYEYPIRLVNPAAFGIDPNEKVDLTRCPLCSLPGPKVDFCISSACEHGCYPAENCFRCHPERCPCRTMRTTMTLPAGATPEAQFLAAQEDQDPIPYQGSKYERSGVVFTHLSLENYLNERELKLPEQLSALLTHMPPGTYIAGGAVAGFICGTNLASDIDLFFHNETAFNEAVKLLSFAGKEQHGEHIPPGARAFAPPEGREGLVIQAINFQWFEDLETVLDSFDFTATMFGIDVEKKELVFAADAALDYQARRLLNHHCEGDDASRKRLAKYITKGFTPVGFTLRRALTLGLWKPLTEAERIDAKIAARVHQVLKESK